MSTRQSWLRSAGLPQFVDPEGHAPDAVVHEVDDAVTVDVAQDAPRRGVGVRSGVAVGPSGPVGVGVGVGLPPPLGSRSGSGWRSATGGVGVAVLVGVPFGVLVPSRSACSWRCWSASHRRGGARGRTVPCSCRRGRRARGRAGRRVRRRRGRRVVGVLVRVLVGVDVAGNKLSKQTVTSFKVGVTLRSVVLKKALYFR